MIETFYFRTELSTRTRQPFKSPARIPHARILEVRQEPFPDKQHVRAMDLTAALGSRIMQYHRNNFDPADGVALNDVNCAHFVQTMVGEGTPDCIDSIKALDAIRGEVVA